MGWGVYGISIFSDKFEMRLCVLFISRFLFQTSPCKLKQRCVLNKFFFLLPVVTQVLIEFIPNSTRHTVVRLGKLNSVFQETWLITVNS